MPVIYMMLMVVMFKIVPPYQYNSLSYGVQPGELTLLCAVMIKSDYLNRVFEGLS